MRSNHMGNALAGLGFALALAGAASAEPARAGRLREEAVVLDTGALRASPGQRLRLSLFRDAAFELDVTNLVRRETGFTVQARIVGEALGTCTLTVENGLVSAGIWSERGTFGLTPGAPVDARGSAISIAEELAPGSAGRCAAFETGEMLPRGVTRESLEARARDGRGVAGRAAGGEHLATDDARAGAAAVGCDCSDDQSIVDVLCVYTTKAKIAAGGAANIQSRFQNAIDAANGAYTNSGINSGGVNRLQLHVAGYVETTYDEVSPSWNDHLDRITNPGDGYMDEVAALRDQYKADTVSLLVDDTRFTGGRAWWAIWDQAQAFSCLNWRAVGGGDLLLAHEIGHNFGCAHDHANDASAPTSYAWGYNFAYNGQTYGTIMSYPGTVRLQYFSNPYLIHPGIGQPLGVHAGQPGAAFNALMIKQTRWTLANYRHAARIRDCNGNGVDDSIDIANGTSLDVNGDCRPDECEEKRYVDAQTPGLADQLSWASASADPSEMLGIANLSCNNISQVWFADGTYKPGGGGTDRYATLSMRSGLAFYGGFQGKSRPGGGETLLSQRDPATYVSILSGEIGNQADPTDNSYAPVNAKNTNASAVLDGFTITKGYNDWSGAGLYIENASPTVRNCLFMGNRAWYGGAIDVEQVSQPVFTNCRFEGNTAVYGGGAISSAPGTTLTLDQCVVKNNTANWGGAISSGNSTVNIRTSTFEGNHATGDDGGAIYANGVTLNIANSLFSGNSSGVDGGALWLANSTVATIANCTVANNSTGTYTGGATVYFATANIANSIFYGNTGGSAAQQDKNLVYYGSSGQARYSRVQGWTGSLGGPGNSGANPKFANAGAGDFSLLAGSSCIDAGDNNALSVAFALDLAGHPRRKDDLGTSDSGLGSAPIIDIGAYEYGLACPSDLNGDGLVEDSDFVIFANAYNVLDCADPSMPAGCPADLNLDGVVDDSDFVIFVAAYNELLCP